MASTTDNTEIWQYINIYAIKIYCWALVFFLVSRVTFHDMRIIRMWLTSAPSFADAVLCKLFLLITNAHTAKQELQLHAIDRPLALA